MEFDEMADGEEWREQYLTSKAVMARGSVYTYLQDDDKSGIVSLWLQIKQTIMSIFTDHGLEIIWPSGFCAKISLPLQGWWIALGVVGTGGVGAVGVMPSRKVV